MWIRKNRKDQLTGKHLPLPTQVVSNEEFYPMPQTLDQQQVEQLILEMADEYGRRLGLSRRRFLQTTGGMAAAFLAMNRVFGESFDVTESDALDAAAFAERTPRDQFIFDAQTHHVKDSIVGPKMFRKMTGKLGLNPALADAPFGDDVLHRENFVKEIFLDSDTAMAMMSGAVIGDKKHHALPVEDMVDTRNMVNETAQSRRMLSHGLADPTIEDPLGDLEYQVNELGIDGLKFYPGNPLEPVRMDDEAVMYPYLERAQELGVKNISIHKGLPIPGKKPVEGKPKNWYWMPDDIPNVARTFPDLNFIIYHAAMENMVATLPPGKSGVGPDGYIPWTTDFVRDRKANPELTNVYPELGTVFAFSVITHPEIAAHLLGQIIDGFGTDHVIWGTDCIWWGSPQWLIEAFRRFQIPQQLQEEFGYAAISEDDRTAIFGQNAAAIYDIDANAMAEITRDDRLATIKAEYLASGAEPSNTTYGWVAA